MKHILPNTIIALLILLSVSSCKNKQAETNGITDTTTTQPTTNKVVDTTVILQVGNEQFSVFELQKNFKMFRQKFFQNNKRQPEQADIMAWIQEFIERAYVLADARAKEYYARKDVQDIVENTAVFMLTQSNGLIDQKLLAQASKKTGISVKEKLDVLKDYHAKINNSASLNTNITEVAQLGALISTHKQKSVVNKEDIAGVSGKKLASYRTPDGKLKDITMEDFMTYYNSLPLRQALTYTENIVNYLRQMAANDHIRKDAKEMGLLNDPEFRLNKKNFMDNVVYTKYYEDQLGKKKQASDQEILNMYNLVKTVMTHPTDIVYSVFTFNTVPDAYKALGLLNTSRSGGADVKLNSVSENRHIKFDKSSSQLPDTLKKMILRIPPGQAAPPIATDGYYTVLMVESATGSKPFSINEIRPYLVARAREVQEINYCHRKAAELSSTFKKVDKINPTMFAGIL